MRKNDIVVDHLEIYIYVYMGRTKLEGASLEPKVHK